MTWSVSATARRLERCRRFSPRAATALDRSEASGYEDPDRGEERKEVAEREADLEPVLGLVDDPVVGDQDERGEADDRGDLAAGPGELVSADHDPGEDERGGRGREQEPTEDREGLPAAAAGLPHPACPVAGFVPALDHTRVRGEVVPGDEQADDQDRGGDHADD